MFRCTSRPVRRRGRHGDDRGGRGLGLPEFDPTAVHGAELTAEQVDAVTERLLALDHDGRAAIGAIHPGRVDVIAAGAVVLRTVMAACRADRLVASEHDILDGIALGLA